jgi:hypothetical protein
VKDRTFVRSLKSNVGCTSLKSTGEARDARAKERAWATLLLRKISMELLALASHCFQDLRGRRRPRLWRTPTEMTLGRGYILCTLRVFTR